MELMKDSSITAYFSGREPYPFEKIIVFRNKTYVCSACEDHYAGAGDSGDIPSELIIDNQLNIGELCAYLSSCYMFFKGDKFCKDIIDFNTFTLKQNVLK